MKMTITGITEWVEDEHMEMGDASHIGDLEVMKLKVAEYEKKVENNDWPGLPFTCEADSKEDAIDQYNEQCCKYNYYLAEEADFEDIHEWESFTLKQLMGTATPDTLFRVIENDDEKAVVLNEDFEADDEETLKILYPYLDRKVHEIEVCMSEDPISPKDSLPTIRVWLEEAEEE